MRITLLVLGFTGCSWLESQPDPTEPAVAQASTAVDTCRVDTVNGDQLRVSIPSSNASIVLPAAADWRTDCTRSQDPEGGSQWMSATSDSLNRSAYILSLQGPDQATADSMLDIATAEMCQVWESTGSCMVDRPYPSQPIAVLRVSDADTVAWQVVRVSQAPGGEWVRMHQHWSCDDCGLDAMGTKYLIDAMVSDAFSWGFQP